MAKCRNFNITLRDSNLIQSYYINTTKMYIYDYKRIISFEQKKLLLDFGGILKPPPNSVWLSKEKIIIIIKIIIMLVK